MKLREWMKIWLERYVKSAVKSRTFTKYEQIVNLHINPYMGNCSMKKIKEMDVQKLLSVDLLANKKLSTSVINAVLSVLKNSLSIAVRQNVLPINPVEKIKRMTPCEKAVEAFSIKEQRLIESYIEKTKNMKLYGIVVCLYTGLRIGELLALTWDDVDMKKKIIKVDKTTCEKNGVNSPKSKSGIRTVPISSYLLPLIKQLYNVRTCKFVIETKGKNTQVRGYQELFARLVKKLGIPYKSFHSLRHTFATRAIESGMNYKTLSVLMGHSNAMITINRYAHCFADEQRRAMEKISKIVKNK